MNLELFSPPAPGVISVHTFQDLRRFVQDFIVNRWMQYVNGYMNTSLLPVLNSAEYNYGPDLVSGATIKPTAKVQKVTGGAVISTIVPPPTSPATFSGSLFLIAQDGFSTDASGNILQAVTVPAGHMAVFAYHAPMAKWGVVTS